MDLEANIRKLARSSYYQNIYNASKECYGINMFENNKNFSGMQSLFLYWVKVYDFLYGLLSQREFNNLKEWVIEDDVRCDAFLHYHRLEQVKKINEHNKGNNKLNKSNSSNFENYSVYKGVKKKDDE